MTLETVAPLQRISEQLVVQSSDGKSWASHSPVPVPCLNNKEPVLLGVGEAGRGPVLDALATLRNYFHEGAYQAVISDASGPSQTTPDLALERQVLLYRAHLSLGNTQVILQQISPSDPPELQAVKVFAKRLAGKETAKACLSEMEACVNQAGGPGKNPMVGAVAGTFYAREGLLEEALRVVSSVSYNMECLAIKIQLLLLLNRSDLARNDIEILKSKGDDRVAAQLIEAWLNLHLGGQTKNEEAYYIFEELVQTGMNTEKLLVGQAVSQMAAGDFTLAESNLEQSYTKNAKHPETLLNLLSCAIAKDKSGQVIDQYKQMILQVAPEHSFTAEWKQKDVAFERAASKFV